jgi:tungstate transport system ATP-binding protein
MDLGGILGDVTADDDPAERARDGDTVTGEMVGDTTASEVVGATPSDPAAGGFAGDDQLVLSAVSHRLGGTAILEGVDLTVRQGETLAIIGPSGTGKTTLLRLCALFERPTAGAIRVGETDVWAATSDERLAARRRIGMVFQEPKLFDGSVGWNVAYGRRIRRSRGERLRRWLDSLLGDHGDDPAVEAALETVGLAGKRTADTGSLSGGEAQRVAFARALAYDPDVLLLDEPTSDLDPRNTAVIEEAVETARAAGRGVALATHDMQQARRVADRVAVLLDGRLIEVGPTERVFESPEDPRARRFIDGELVY